MSQRFFSKSQARKLRAEYESGKTTDELAEKYGCSTFTVWKTIPRVGGKMRPHGPQELFDNPTQQQLRKEYESGLSLSKLAEKYNASATTIFRVLRKDGGKLRPSGEARQSANGLSHVPEYRTVVAHYSYIFGSRSKDHPTYGGMPFFGGWNPDKGGAFYLGAEWIIANLGKRPKGCSLHIVEHEKGFVPGNLEWASAKKQIAEQMHKIIANQKHEIRALKARIEELEKAA